MKPNMRNVAPLAAALAITLLVGSQVSIADDTEIFVAEPPPGSLSAANILFIIDTSGSMDGAVTTQQDWDPRISFTGSCDPNRVYWITGNVSAPVCSGRNNTDNYVSTASFQCTAAAAALARDGLATINNAIQWDNSSSRARDYVWEQLDSGRRTVVDCRLDVDSPVADGILENDGLTPLDGRNGPYGTSPPAANWWTSNNRNRSYTFYSGNYLNWLRTGGTVTKTRLQIVQEVTKTTLDRLSNVNVGLMVFNETPNTSNDQGGRIMYPIGPIDTARQPIKDIIDTLDHEGNTPLSETLFEAYNYWRGNAPRYPGTSVSSSISGGNFITPLGLDACSKNYTVLLTDGEPTQDQDVNTVVPALPGFLSTDSTPVATSCSNNSTGGENGRCLDDIAKYMYTHDMYPATASVSDTVITHTVGFGGDVAGSTTLQRTADAGGGTAYEASDTASLSDVFETIIREIVSQDVSFTAPAVSVNAFNRTQNLNDLFISVFAPADTLHWPGNLKKYRLDDEGVIRDADGEEAVDARTGFFRVGSRSFWSAREDDAVVSEGGAARKIPVPLSRNVYSNLTATANLANSANAVTGLNLNLRNAMLGLTPSIPVTEILDVERLALVEWIRGADIDRGAPLVSRQEMGDPIHARPVSVIYGGSPGSPNINDAVVYFATNDGYLHAINPHSPTPEAGGNELWSFIPQDLLIRMRDLRENERVTSKGYGLDGNVVAYKLDVNNDGIVDRGEGDKVLLFFGMGRGGEDYYALDVSDKNAPQFLWKQGADRDMFGLGQTWSTPVVTKMNIAGSGQHASQLVVVVGGGYDASQDSVPYNTDATGNRLYILDAISGAVLWSAGPSSGTTGLGYNATAPADFENAKFTHSIPADVRVIDITGDGLADRMYAADTGGQVWRFDIHNNQSRTNLVTGGIFASLGNAHEGTHPVTSSRRFYNAPDASLMRVNGQMIINLAIGSGYRGHPINAEIQDRFYSLRDYQPFASLAQSVYDDLVTNRTYITESNLTDITTTLTPTLPVGSKGWLMMMNQPSWQGEKVLAESRTFSGTILFTTFTPIPSASTQYSCTVTGVKNSLYAVNALDGSPARNRDGSGPADELDDRRTDLAQGGIAPPPVILFPSPDEPTACTGAACSPPPVCLVGVEQCGVGFTNTPVRTFWSQQNVDTN